MSDDVDIIYTKVDEAPQLASASFLPIIRAFSRPAGISFGTKDISLAGRILAQFPSFLTDQQRQTDDLTELGKIVKEPWANVVKLPNISASVPQLKAAIAELQSQGYNVPDYPESPATTDEISALAAYDRIKGSAVNPVLREGNSDRRAPNAVKEFAKKNPHSMGVWTSSSKTHVVSMKNNDFFSNEKSITITEAQSGEAHIEFRGTNGTVSILKEAIALHPQEIVDASFMSAKALRIFLAEQIKQAKFQEVLFSVHLKATMMKVSDPVIFGHAVSVFLKDVFEKHSKKIAEIGVEPNNGIGDLESKIATLRDPTRAEIERDLAANFASGPPLYMVNSDKHITNLHVPSDVIIDASMPALIRNGGKGWGPDGQEADVKCVIPDSSYAPVYEETIEFCKKYGAFNPSEMGTIPNVGLMAQKAEEYGSHPHTFVVPGVGTVKVVAANGDILHEHRVESGDIWRMCMVKDRPVQDWVKLAVTRARATGAPAIFWLNKERAHDDQLIQKVNTYLGQHNTIGLNISIMAPADATRFSLRRLQRGEDTISVTGNVLRDYLTDLFPILEVGTSAKMLSIVPLMNGGGLFETGAGGSAPKHVEQMVEEGHLRWDSLGEFCALGASLEHYESTSGNAKAGVLAKTLDAAIGKLLQNNRSPGRTIQELDNRGSHFYLALYWSQALAAQDNDRDLSAHFHAIAQSLEDNETTIIQELTVAKGTPVDLGGYYHPDDAKMAAAMRPSPTLNRIITSAEV
ncbi:MAG: isocitrate dehydrogenase (NADP(+)) [Rhodospirillaceae bacterium TMED8]|nr:isocitrate dehydrogenase (NADP(+)) [Magnetovibrio sp.]OUT48319.1 MAG: isocitrate dehydrogenase (NADP(+)) [Rhodospirillaceae bacterium TMED8]